MSFRKAERKQAKARIGIFSPSGGGKTFSALQIASGLGKKIAMVDTERGRGELYSDTFDYDVCPIAPPFTPVKYVQAIQEAEDAGYDVLILDSITHAWSGEGGMLDMHDKVTQASRTKNSYVAWRKVTPEHNKLVDKFLQCNMHVIITCRVKTAYETQEKDGGKKGIVKVGLAPVFKEGLEYEMTLCFDIDQESHMATVSKGIHGLTEIFEEEHFLLSEKEGKTILNWFNSGAVVTQTVTAEDVKAEFEEPPEKKHTWSDKDRNWFYANLQEFDEKDKKSFKLYLLKRHYKADWNPSKGFTPDMMIKIREYMDKLKSAWLKEKMREEDE